MKLITQSIIYLYVLIGGVNSIHAETLEIQGSKIELLNNCRLNVTYPNQENKILKLSLPDNAPCKIVNHTNTNIIQLEQVTNYYLFLIESTSLINNKCQSIYTAIAVSNKGGIVSTPGTKRSSSCGIGRERKVFETFAYKMKILK